jgi:hypothetical protein
MRDLVNDELIAVSGGTVPVTLTPEIQDQYDAFFGSYEMDTVEYGSQSVTAEKKYTSEAQAVAAIKSISKALPQAGVSCTIKVTGDGGGVSYWEVTCTVVFGRLG